MLLPINSQVARNNCNFWTVNMFIEVANATVQVSHCYYLLCQVLLYDLFHCPERDNNYITFPWMRKSRHCECQLIQCKDIFV